MNKKFLLILFCFIFLAGCDFQDTETETCIESKTASGDKIVKCEIKGSNGISTYHSYPYWFWNTTAPSYSNNNGIYTRVSNIADSYSATRGTTTAKSGLGSTGKTSGGGLS